MPNETSGRRRAGLGLACLTLSTVLVASTVPQAQAAENGVSWYLLGLRGPGGALTPPEGVFLQNDVYHYSGNSGLTKSLPLNGSVGVGIDGKATANLLTALWMTPLQLGGARFGLSLTQPYGGPTIAARATASLPLGIFRPISAGRTDSASFFGDPIVSGFFGWTSGNWNFQAGTSVNVPIGTYDKNGIANMSFHRWANDYFVSATWLNADLGIDVSSTLGYTFNGTNNFTQYKTGNEIHWEGSVSKSLTQSLSVGVLGYYYEQVTADSGAGASLGAFQGRVAAVGGTVGYTFKVGIVPISTRLKVFREFDARNKLGNGTAGFLTLAMPVWVPGM